MQASGIVGSHKKGRYQYRDYVDDAGRYLQQRCGFRSKAELFDDLGLEGSHSSVRDCKGYRNENQRIGLNVGKAFSDLPGFDLAGSWVSGQSQPR